jgi:hypothetical protein
VMQRPTDLDSDDTTPYSPVMANASPFAMEMAQEIYIETELEEQAAQDEQHS